MRTYVLDGARIDSLAAFYDEVTSVMLGGRPWGRNLDAWNDVLRGGFGTPEEGFRLVWRHSARSRATLGDVFDTIVEIARDHGVAGEQAEDHVELVLEE